MTHEALAAVVWAAMAVLTILSLVAVVGLLMPSSRWEDDDAGR